MAKLILQGDAGDVLILGPGEGVNDDEETWLAMCQRDGCSWREEYDSLGDAREYADGHADFGPHD